jgi:peptidyl-prolyl cis-trans isomerase A (cyclophilin A)
MILRNLRTARIAGGRFVRLLLAGVLAIALSSAVRAQAPASSTGATSQGTTTKKKSTTTTTPVRQFDRALLHPALLRDKAPDEYKVKFTTTRGDFVVTVTRVWAPLGADRFYSLVKHHFYDNASFFRVLPGFVVQFGISAYPPVSAAWKSAVIKDDPVVQSNLRGYLVFATSGANSRTTQVFVNLVDNKRLDGMGFAPFGQVTDGMNVVEMLYDQYGEGAPQGSGPDQDQIEKQGKPYLDKGWPKLDFIKTTAIISPTPTPAAAKPAPKPAPAKAPQ